MSAQSQENTLTIQPKRVMFFVGAVGVVLVILGFISQYLRLFPDSINVRFPYQADLITDFKLEFDFDGRSSIAIFFNVLLLNMAVCLMFVITHLKKINKDKYRFSWTAMAWVVLFFAIDNLADLSKKIEIIVKDKEAGSVGVDLPWVLTVTGILFALFFLFWVQLDGKYKNLFLVSIVLCLGGVLVKGFAGLQDFDALIYAVYLSIAQALQYAGGILLSYSLFQYLIFTFPNFIVLAAASPKRTK
jgi:hypothetical protein